MSDLLNQASLVMVPSGYKEDTVYSVVPTDGSGDLSFTRASNGTRVNSAGLVEVVAWNLAQQSETFDNASWTKVNTTITANNTTAPNGTTTADKFAPNGTLTATYFSLSQEVVSGATSQAHTAIVYVKAGGLTQMLMYLGNQIGIYFNLSNGQFISYYNGVQTITNYSSEAVGDGWYKYTISISNNSGSTYLEVYGAKSGAFIGNYTTADNFFVWGAQLNIGSTAKPYFPTTDRLNVPRLTYQNGGGGCPSLLLEKQSTNFQTYSQDFTNVAWTKLGQGVGDTAVVTANYAISPDGTQNATRFVCNLNGGTTSSDRSWMIANFTAQATSTISIWIKLNSAGTKTVLLSDSGGGSKTISGTDWQRIDATFVGAGGEFRIGLIGGSTSDTLDCCIWGAQAEAGSYATSYIPTTSSSATRVADACFKTGISSLIGQTEGVVFWDIEIETLSATGNENILNIDDGTGFGNTIYLFKASNGILFAVVYVSGVGQCSLSYTLPSVGRYKMALAYKANDFAFYVNGVSRGTDSSGSVPTCSRLQMGNGTLGPSDGKINQTALFKTRLSNSELASLTTI